MYKYSLNETYFDIFTNNNCYILGFLTADGHIDDNHRSRLTIGLSSKDICILSFIKNELEYTGIIYDRYNLCQGKRFPSNYLCMSSKYLINKLKEKGLCNKKELNTILNNIPETFKADFIRGYFDGDGCISFFNRKRFINNKEYNSIEGKIQFTAKNNSFLDNFNQNFLQNRLNLNKVQNYYVLSSGKKSIIQAIYQIMYYNKNLFCLLRKKDKFIQFLGESK